MRVEVRGPVCWLGQETVDHRLVYMLTMGALPIPVMLLGAPGEGDGGSRLVGQLFRVIFEYDQVVMVEGEVDEEFAPPPGQTWGCGIDTTVLQFERDGEVEKIHAKLLGVTLYHPDSGSEPAYPDAYLRRHGRGGRMLASLNGWTVDDEVIRLEDGRPYPAAKGKIVGIGSDSEGDPCLKIKFEGDPIVWAVKPRGLISATPAAVKAYGLEVAAPGGRSVPTIQIDGDPAVASPLSDAAVAAVPFQDFRRHARCEACGEVIVLTVSSQRWTSGSSGSRCPETGHEHWPAGS